MKTFQTIIMFFEVPARLVQHALGGAYEGASPPELLVKTLGALQRHRQSDMTPGGQSSVSAD